MRIRTEYVTTENGQPIELQEIYCTSSETKPTTGLAMGSVAIEVDTGDVFFFNETSGTWVEQ